jgi:hypothetical protein
MVAVKKDIFKETMRFKRPAWIMPAVTAVAIFTLLFLTQLHDRKETRRADTWAETAGSLYSYMAQDIYPTMPSQAQEKVTRFCDSIAFPAPAEYLAEQAKQAAKKARSRNKATGTNKKSET